MVRCKSQRIGGGGMTRERSPQDTTALTMAAPPGLERVRIVLVEPRRAVNVGASARAMSTMGLRDLRLVRSLVSRQAPEAQFVAHNARGVLDAAQEFPGVLAACADTTLVVGTTNRRRTRVMPDPAPIREVASRIASECRARPVAVLFGSEDTGLQTEDLCHCHLLATVPACA
jgi:TrmH family RNA methyltransferase